MLALTHLPSLHMAQCLRTDTAAPPIEPGVALTQHAGYRRMLERCGATVITLEVNSRLPDCVFIEDTAVVLPEVAIVCSMGHAARRGEPDGIEPVLRRYREVRRIALPATIDGGDVLRIGRRLMVGLSQRTDRAAVETLEQIVRPFGYRVDTVAVAGCLHLKSACTALPDGRLLANPAWLERRARREYAMVEVAEDEPHAANVALVGDTVCAAAGYRRTAELIAAQGFSLETTPLSEFAKADGCVTCLGLLLDE